MFISITSLGFISGFNLGPVELSIIAFLALVFFGRDKLPGFARDLGSSMKEFKTALTTDDGDKKASLTEDSEKAQVAKTETVEEVK